MKRLQTILFSVVVLYSASLPAAGTVGDCLWGGSNEETAYTRPYVVGMGGVTLNTVASPGTNTGAPPPAIPVQATPNTQSVSVPQATIPTITTATGPVGTVGMPATQPHTTQATQLPQQPPGTEIVYVLPPKETSKEECLDGVKGLSAHAATVVPPGTPGAVPMAVRTINVLRPKVEYRWSYSPIREKTETLVKVVDPRTGRVVRTFCRSDETRSNLPWLHRREIITYEKVPARVGTPVAL